MPEMQVSFLNMSAEGEGSPKKSKKYLAFIGIGVIAAAVGLSSTLAANININAGPVEFGQGVAQTVACSGDESIIVTPATSFTNAPSSVERLATFYGGDTFTVTSTEDLSVGMLMNIPADGQYIITEISGLEVRMNLPNLESEFLVTFTPSSGTEQTLTPISTDNDPSGEPIGASSMVLPQTSIEIGMLVSGPGIPSNTTVVYVESGANLYIELSKDIDDRGQELTFTNSGKSSFKLSDITVSGIPDSCTNKVFTIKLYDNESAEPLRISSGDIGDSSAQVWWANGYGTDDHGYTSDNEAVIQFPALYAVWGSGETNAYNGGPAIETADTPMSTMADGAFKINLPMSLDASRVYKITVESQDDSDSLNVNNAGYGFYDWWWD
jgi:hypothetical protein